MCGIAAIGLATGVVGGVFQGLAQRASSRYNAGVLKQQADITAVQGAEDERIQREQGAQSLGQSRTAIAKSGVTNSGSALDLLSRSAGAAELDAQKVRYSSQLEVNRLRSQAKIEKRQGNLALIGSAIGAGTSLLTGVNQIQNDNQRRKILGY